MIIPRIMNIIPSVKTQLGKAAILAKPVRVKMITIIIDIIIPTYDGIQIDIKELLSSIVIYTNNNTLMNENKS